MKTRVDLRYLYVFSILLLETLTSPGLAQGTGRLGPAWPRVLPVTEAVPVIREEIADCFVPVWTRVRMTSGIINPQEVPGEAQQLKRSLALDCRLYPVDCTDLMAMSRPAFPHARAVDDQGQLLEQLPVDRRSYDLSLFALACDRDRPAEQVHMQFELDPNQVVPARLAQLDWTSYALAPSAVRVVTMPFSSSNGWIDIVPGYQVRIDETFSDGNGYRYCLSTRYTGNGTASNSHMVVRENQPLPEYVLMELSLLNANGRDIIEEGSLPPGVSGASGGGMIGGSGGSGGGMTGGSGGSGGGMSGGSGGSGSGMTGGSGGFGGSMSGGSGSSGGGMTGGSCGFGGSMSGGSGGSGGGMSSGSGSSGGSMSGGSGSSGGGLTGGSCGSTKFTSLTTPSGNHSYTENYNGNTCTLTGIGTGWDWGEIKSIQLRIAIDPYEVKIPYVLTDIPVPYVRVNTPIEGVSPVGDE